MIELDKIFESDEFIIINKPAGVSVHKGANNMEEETIADALISLYPELKEVGESILLKNGIKIEKPGIVHRLDKGTSGVMVIAKTNEVYQELKKKFEKRKIKKEYSAFVYGKIKRGRGILHSLLGKSRIDFRKWTSKNPRGEIREAQTDYVVIKECEENTSFVKFYPMTGRTHQIRTQARGIQHPIVGDPLYAHSRPKLFGFERLALHSRQISFKLHNNEEEYTFKAPYPEDFKRAMSKCGIDCNI